MDPPIATETRAPQHRTRLVLKDGSFQVVLSYKVVGNRVRFRSAERDGEQEEIPLSLVDLPATEAWQHAHDGTEGAAESQAAPVLSPELAREEVQRAAQHPEVAPNLRLPEADAVLVLDTFQGTPELVPLQQSGTELNRETAHDVERKMIPAAASPHDLVLLKGEKADVQLHVPDPVFFVRLESGSEEVQGNALVVDTEGHSPAATAARRRGESSYVLEHVDVRQGARAVASMRLNLLGTGRSQPNIIELRAEELPGGVWLKLVPATPLEFGEYALIEILDDRSINTDVWEFGVHPTARENDEALRPEVHRPVQLERRRP